MSSASLNAIRVHPRDNIAVAVKNLSKGDALALQSAPAKNEGLSTSEVFVSEDINSGHKIALCDIKQGAYILKFGQIIGEAKQHICAGEHVHVHNISMPVAQVDSDIRIVPSDSDKISTENNDRHFLGFHRSNGDVGTRNYIGILTSVNCSASVAKMIAAHFTDERLKPYKNVDGVVAFTHRGGCGMAAKDSEGLENLQRTLAGYAEHPNFSNILMLGLGCEVNQIQPWMKKFNYKSSDTFKWMTIQDQGGTRATLDRGIKAIEAMLEDANSCVRKPAPLSHLTLALQCGGSDGYSGITANPALGAASDLLVKAGATVVLSETPEIYGAEHLLLNRVSNKETADKLIARLNWWKAHAVKHDIELNNNPSPGNQKGGLTTILEKSLGAVAKAGTTPLNGFYHYAEKITNKGFVFMDAPGFDPCSVTGEIASGANLVCFTTGRGSVFGAKPAPSIKLASNSTLFNNMQDDMDINCGKILDGEVDVQQMGEEIFNFIIDVASGKPTKSEEWGFGDNEFIPWQLGAML
uniref:UxaA family hydrolase n=1 Tax=Ningiella ruwaisensis TaxID=2364274 RepID=UPI00109F9A87|nr:altronate dehydratase family protein [Ningiella ruwaisensis]